MPYKDKAKDKEYHAKYLKKWTKNRRGKCNEYKRTYYKQHKKELIGSQLRYRQSHRDKTNALSRTYYMRLRLLVLSHYGGRCICCSESEKEFLTIDHINNDGSKHRKVIPGERLYQWLKNNNFPEGFQILCRNCNWSKHIGKGVCVHKRTHLVDLASLSHLGDLS